jgi:GTPase KRas
MQSEGQGFALVYSVASRSTFDRLELFRQVMLRAKRYPPIFILVGNKADKSWEREVSKEEGQDLAEKLGCDFIEASAKTGQCVNDLFINLVRKLRGTLSGVPLLGVPLPGQAMKKVKDKSCIVM